MTIRVAIHHHTRYDYERPITLGPQTLRLRPAPHTRTPIHNWSLHVGPDDHFVNWQQDPFGNHLGRYVFPERTKHLEFTVDLVVDLVAFNPFDFFLEPEAEEYPFTYSKDLKRQLAPYLKKQSYGDRFKKFLNSIDATPDQRTIDFLVECNQKVANSVEYLIRMEPGVQTPGVTLKKGSGSCRDSAWLLVHVLRNFGIAARFVSGYLVQLSQDEKDLDGPSGPEEDFTDLHAWCEAFVPGAGWIGLDATSGLFAAEGHIPVACTPEPGAAAPITGGLEPCKSTFDFEMSVTRVREEPRISKPYTDETWDTIDRAGKALYERPCFDEMKLTVGGEPTFVGIDNPDADEWNTHALGDEKERIGRRMLTRLRDCWSAPGSLLHHGQGKWYPGEQLPRWAYGCYWRTDGEPLWPNQDLFADIENPGNHTVADAEKLLASICERLQLEAAKPMLTFEDPWYYCWRERQLPGNVDPFDSKMSDELERARLEKVFKHRLDNPVGVALPVRWKDDAWETGKWFLRRERCYLMPGDSAIGYRLPLDSLPWNVPEEEVSRDPLDPFAARPDLPTTKTAATTLPEYAPGRWSGPTDDIPRKGPVSGIVRQALCIEPRDGVLRVFLPPIDDLAAFAECIRAIHDSVEEHDLQVLIEGYKPPRDQRLREFQVTPDPGVLEFNVPPVAGWEAQQKQIDELFAAAKQERLRAHKFLVDGRQVGSGGGCHMVFGSTTPADSPFLRNPKFLASMLRYWHNHPSLSYSFSGLFIGPSCQAPRVDEAGVDKIPQLELALRELEAPGEVPAWKVDRVLRHILTDVTGNTHRAEFCIDKLFSPDSSTGRLGLLELRGFEMPAHERMFTAQALLVQSIMARCWEHPYDAPLARWDSGLQDRWMLPWHQERDLADICLDLQQHGLHCQPEWFVPHLYHRFPVIGRLNDGPAELEIRHAAECWPVLGEEQGGGGQVRYVDSSLERVQLVIRGATPGRHKVVVNGYEAPLRPAGENGALLAGVRYRAWWPPSCLHPTIGLHAPLRVDLYDQWAGRAIAGCTYHVSHPGGRSFDTSPINEREAEGRRLQRVQIAGHTPDAYKPKIPHQPDEAPWTLDLRHQASPSIS